MAEPLLAEYRKRAAAEKEATGATFNASCWLHRQLEQLSIAIHRGNGLMISKTVQFVDPLCLPCAPPEGDTGAADESDAGELSESDEAYFERATLRLGEHEPMA
eukprot:1641078-Prymnesium_polylepis.1